MPPTDPPNPSAPLDDRTLSLDEFAGASTEGGPHAAASHAASPSNGARPDDPDATGDLPDPAARPSIIPSAHSAPHSASGSTGSSVSGLSSSFNHGRFVPGTILANRYRIVAMVGRGGMGEVFRADDLKLGQTVALKFTPPGVATDPAAIARLHSEVRLAREIAHPNVCRVYDVGDVEGQPYLSMQYVDGENLASLIRRIDRLPEEKALDLARQLITGVAAAHERGVLHRDLKPANVMLDDRGKLLITDFGLSAVIDTNPQDAAIVGTPAYMAPEQLNGQTATVRSDVYSLGLVLYELFTGRPVFKADSYAELMRQRERYDPNTLAEVMERVDVDPMVRQVILRCLERDPLRRPPRALSVLAALPGGDPLAAAIAAGETPSPEMVAAAGGSQALTIRKALPLLGAVILSVLLLGVVNAMLLETVPPVPVDADPAILADHAAQSLRAFGFPAEGAPASGATATSGGAVAVPPAPYRAWGMEWDREFFAAVQRGDPTTAAPGAAPSRRAGGMFWYRQGTRPLVPAYLSQPVTLNDPPVSTPGIATVVFGPGRQLLRLVAAGPVIAPDLNGSAGQADLRGIAAMPAAVPSAIPAPVPAVTSAAVAMAAKAPGTADAAPPRPRPSPTRVDWEPFLKSALLDPANLREAAPIITPPVHADHRQAWTIDAPTPGRSPGGPARAVRVEAASLAGRPVYFAVLRPWEVPTGRSTGPAAAEAESVAAVASPGSGVTAQATAAPVSRSTAAPQARSVADRAFDYVGFFVRWSIWAVAGVLAFHNARVGRWDRKNAFRLGLIVFALYTAGTILRAAHQAPSVAEHNVLFNSLGQGLLRGTMAWLFYLALEPYIRRAWPDWLISWARLLAGQFRDPLVGRDVLGGLAVAAVAAAASGVALVLFVRLGGALPAPGVMDVPDALRTNATIVAALLWNLAFALLTAAAYPFVAAAVLNVTGSRRSVFPVTAIVLFLLMFAPAGNMVLTAVTVAVAVAARLFAMSRFGVLGLAACSLGLFVLQTFPPVLDMSPWYAGSVWTVVAFLLALAVYAFRNATRGRTAFGEPVATVS